MSIEGSEAQGQEVRPDGLVPRTIKRVDLLRILEMHFGVRIRRLNPMWGINVNPQSVAVTLEGIGCLCDPDPAKDVEEFLEEAREQIVVDGGEDPGGGNDS